MSWVLNDALCSGWTTSVYLSKCYAELHSDSLTFFCLLWVLCEPLCKNSKHFGEVVFLEPGSKTKHLLNWNAHIQSMKMKGREHVHHKVSPQEVHLWYYMMWCLQGWSSKSKPVELKVSTYEKNLIFANALFVEFICTCNSTLSVFPRNALSGTKRPTNTLIRQE